MKTMDPLNAFLQAADTPMDPARLSISLAVSQSPFPTAPMLPTTPDWPTKSSSSVPGSIDQAHGAEEWIEISELERMRDILLHLVGVGLSVPMAMRNNFIQALLIGEVNDVLRFCLQIQSPFLPLTKGATRITVSCLPYHFVPKGGKRM